MKGKELTIMNKPNPLLEIGSLKQKLCLIDIEYTHNNLCSISDYYKNIKLKK